MIGAIANLSMHTTPIVYPSSLAIVCGTSCHAIIETYKITHLFLVSDRVETR